MMTNQDRNQQPQHKGQPGKKSDSNQSDSSNFGRGDRSEDRGSNRDQTNQKRDSNQTPKNRPEKDDEDSDEE